MAALLIITIYSGLIMQCSQVTTSLMDKVRRILVHICKDGGVPQPVHFLQVSISCPWLPSKEWLLKSDSRLLRLECDRILQRGWRWWGAGELLPGEEPVHPSQRRRRRRPGWKEEPSKGERRKLSAVLATQSPVTSQSLTLWIHSAAKSAVDEFLILIFGYIVPSFLC